GHDLDDARVALRGPHVEEGNAAARDAGDCQHGMQHPGRVVIRGIAGLALDLQYALTAGQWLADIRAVPGISGSAGEAEFRSGAMLRIWVRKRRRGGRECAAAFPLRLMSARAR